MIQTRKSETPSNTTEGAGDQLAIVAHAVLHAIKSIEYGSVEIVIRNSRIVQIERKEKFYFD